MAVGATAPPPPPGASGSATMELYRWAEKEVSGVGAADRLKISDLTERAKERFTVKQDWVDRFVDEALTDMVRSVCRQVVASTRGGYKKYIFKDTVLGVQTYAEQTTKEAATLHMKLMSKWGQWMEFNGQQHVRLFEMTRQDLLQAAAERERRAERELEIAALWRAMAAQMTDSVVVRDVFNPAQIEALSVDIKTARGSFTEDPDAGPTGPDNPIPDDDTDIDDDDMDDDALDEDPKPEA